MGTLHERLREQEGCGMNAAIIKLGNGMFAVGLVLLMFCLWANILGLMEFSKDNPVSVVCVTILCIGGAILAGKEFVNMRWT
jgi:hypothetical protein